MSEPIRLATIGTSPISNDLLDAATQVDDIKYVGTYSRNPITAREFTERHGGTRPFTTLEQLANCEDVDAVYIASPNALHFDQALACISGNKHILIEKPACSNRFQAQSLYAAAELHHVIALEAMRPIHDPAWAKIFDSLEELGTLRRATFRFGKYSSRYDDVKAGRHTNIFDTKMASGALMDMGIYTVEPMVALFGMPDRIVAAPTLISDSKCETTNGIIDGAGSVLCTYGPHSGTPGLVVELAYSKISTDLLPSQIEGDLGTMTIDSMASPQHVSIMTRGKAVRGSASTESNRPNSTTRELDIERRTNNMVYELRDFVSLIRGEKLDTLWGREITVRGALQSYDCVTFNSLSVCDEIRNQAHIHFPADFRFSSDFRVE